MPKLIIRGSDGETRSVELSEGTSTLGRSSRCTFPLQDNNTSREHCEIILLGGKALVRDRESTNGTLVNGKKTTESVLQPGDCIRIGTTDIFFEVEPSSSKPPEPRAVEGASPSAESDTRRETVRTPKEKEVVTSRTTTPAVRAGAGAIADFTFVASGKSSGWGRRTRVVFPLVLVFAVVLSFLLWNGGASPEGGSEDLLRGGGTFESAASANEWSFSSPGGNRLHIDREEAKSGAGSLILELSGGADDLAVPCLFGPELPLGRNGGIELSFWAKSEISPSWGSCRIEWLDGIRGGLLCAENSPPTSLSSSWGAISGRFRAPRGAAAFRLGVTVVGRKGRIRVDDVKARPVVGSPPSPVAASLEKDGIRIEPCGGGVFLLEQGTQRLLRDVGFLLRSDRDGTIPQSLALHDLGRCETREDRIRISGRILNPVDLQEIEFEETVGVEKGEVTVVYELRGDGVKQLDALLVRALLPAETQSSVEGEKNVGQVRIRNDESNVLIRYLEEVPVRVSAVRGGIQLEQRFPLIGKEGRVGWQVDTGSTRSLTGTPREAAQAARQAGRPGEALGILREALGETRDREERQSMEELIAALEEEERQGWDRVLAPSIRASLSGRPADVRQAREAVAAYERAWTLEEQEAKVALLLASIPSNPGPDEGRRRVLEELADRCAQRGWTVLSDRLVEFVRSRPESPEEAGGK